MSEVIDDPITSAMSDPEVWAAFDCIDLDNSNRTFWGSYVEFQEKMRQRGLSASEADSVFVRIRAFVENTHGEA